MSCVLGDDFDFHRAGTGTHSEHPGSGCRDGTEPPKPRFIGELGGVGAGGRGAASREVNGLRPLGTKDASGARLS